MWGGADPLTCWVDPEHDYVDLGELVDQRQRERAAPTFPKTTVPASPLDD